MKSPAQPTRRPSRPRVSSPAKRLPGLALAGALLACACSDSSRPVVGADGEARIPEASTSTGSRSVLLNADGRAALGLVLEQAERRGRGPLLEFPAAIEPTFDAVQVASAPLEGRVEVVAAPLSAVAEGELLFALDAPSWRALQSELAAVRAELEGHAAWLLEVEGLERAHRRHEEALSALEGRWSARLEQLEAIRAAGGGQAAALVTAQAALLDARARLAEAQEVGARLSVDRAERWASRASAEAKRESLLARASTLTGVSVEELVVEGGAGQAWWAIDRIEVRARRSGQVVSLETSDGAWAEAGDAVMRVRRPDAVCVKGSVFQADLPGLVEGTPVRVRPSDSSSGGVAASLRLGLAADARERSAEVYAFFSGSTPPAWARPGLSVVISVPAPGARIEVRTVVEGLPAEQSLELVTVPLEGALQGLPGVARLTSSSSIGGSLVGVEFHGAVVAEEALTRVADCVAAASGALPPGATPSASIAILPSRVAVPTGALRRDGADRVVWVQNPVNSMELLAVSVQVIEEGPEWTFIESPIEPGNRVVARGAGRLALAAQGASQSGGHFHADGTFHAEEH